MQWRDISTPELLTRTLQAHGGARILPSPGTPAPVVSPLRVPDVLQDVLTTLQTLTEEYGWSDSYTYNATGEDAGLHVWLVRDTEVLYAEVKRQGEQLSRSQQAYLKVLGDTGKIEVYVWTPQDLPTIRQRLERTHVPR